MNALLIERLKEARNNKGLKQQEVADQLGIKANTISNWEKGRTEPDIDTFVKLCQIYQINCATLLSEVYAFKRISNDISLMEYEYIKKYRNLDNHGKELVDIVLEKEYDRCMTVPTHFSSQRIIQYYHKLASAGNGQFVFEDLPADLIEIPDSTKYKDVKYAIGVNGSSMEPLYRDGDILLVKPAEDIPVGKIGIFLVDGQSYVKQRGKDMLISLNKDFDDIPFAEDSKCLGEVVERFDKEN